MNAQQLLMKILKEASASENPPQHIVDEIEKLKDIEPELYKIIEHTRNQMLEAIQEMSEEDKERVVEDFQKIKDMNA